MGKKNVNVKNRLNFPYTILFYFFSPSVFTFVLLTRLSGILLVALFWISRIIQKIQTCHNNDISILCSSYLRSDYTWGSGRSGFTLETLWEENISEFISISVWAKVFVVISDATHSLSSLARVSGQSVLSGRSLKTRKREGIRTNDWMRYFDSYIYSVNVTYRWTLRAGESSRSLWSQ